MAEGTQRSADDTLVADESGSGATSHTASSAIEPGTVIGRYVVVARIGAGGMGVVHTAYDPELDRKVALKLLQRRREKGADLTEGDARLVREAQAMARLNHPNVVTVHDVGTWRGQIFIAMEFIEGRTFGAWSKESPRSWREVLDVMIPAARGLAAAHAVGLVHRDVKPDNVMVGGDGRVRVMDFGLARTGRRESRKEDGPGDALAIELTRDGEMLGTPAYMAPEQHLGLDTDARTDEFCYCVMLWEALFGERPFAGDSLAALAVAVTQGLTRPPPRGTRVPRWLTRVLTRGLASSPQDRYETIDALLAALQQGRAGSRRRTLVAALGSTAVAATIVFAWGEVDRRSKRAACEIEADAIATVWPGVGDQTSDRVREGLLRTGASYAASTVGKVEPWLNGYARAWRDAAASVCSAHRLDRTLSDDLESRARDCLDESRDAFETLADELARADPGMMRRAVSASTGLPRIEPCTDADALARRPMLPTGQRDGVRAIRRELGRVRVLDNGGRRSEAVDAAEQTLAAAQELGWAPLSAEARATLGEVLDRAGDYERSEGELIAAFDEAKTAGVPDVALDAAVTLVLVVGGHRARHAEGRLWARLAEAELVRMGAQGQADEALLLGNRAYVELSAGAYAQAQLLHERAIELWEQTIASDHPDMATLLETLGSVAYTTGDYAHARTRFERALQVREETLGPDHPDVATSLNNLATLYEKTGAFADAKSLHERALAIREHSLGSDHPDVAQSLNNLAIVHRATGSYAQARALHSRALAIREGALGPDHPAVATSLNNLAMVERDMDDHVGAKARFERALAIWRRALGEEHPNIAATLNNLASVHRHLGELADAKALHERALAIQEKVFGPTHPDLAYSLVGLGEVALARDAPDEAIGVLERALELREAADLPADEAAETRFALARALWAARRGRDRAIELAESAASTWRQEGAHRREELDRVERWLREAEKDRRR